MNLIKRPKDFSYEQIDVSIGTANEDTFPTSCPCCGAERTGASKGISAKAEYACGGEYDSIPQIQNHTDKFRGACGLEESFNEQERVAMLVVIYNMYCNWTIFPKELKEKMGTEVPTIKDHVVFKAKDKLSHPTDWVEGYVKWIDENFDKYKPVIEVCRGDKSYGRYLDPRFICGFTDEWEPIYETNPIECLKRLEAFGYNEYGGIQFYSRSFGGNGMLPLKEKIEFIGKDRIKTI